MKRKTGVHWTITLSLFLFHVGLIWAMSAHLVFGQVSTPVEPRSCDTAQISVEFRKVLWCALAGFASGAPAGAREMIVWHKHDAEKVFGSAHSKWVPDYTWRNKYENGDPAQGARYFGSTTFLVWATDPYHAFDTADKVALAGVGFIIGIDFKGWKKMSHRNRWRTVRNAGIYGTTAYVARGLAFHAVYSGVPQLMK